MADDGPKISRHSTQGQRCEHCHLPHVAPVAKMDKLQRTLIQQLSRDAVIAARRYILVSLIHSSVCLDKADAEAFAAAYRFVICFIADRGFRVLLESRVHCTC